jgi:tRNA threonylcarbamoyladenosine biosynthesis protein TsaB
VDTKRGRLVLEVLTPGAWQADAPPRPLALEDLPSPDGPVAVVGDAAPQVVALLLERGSDAVATESLLPQASAAGQVALRRLDGRLPPREATPLYVEQPAVRMPG